MPRASRHFLPGYVWHITHRYPGKFVPNVQVVRRAHHERIYSQPLRSVQAVDEDGSDEFLELSEWVTGAVICTGCSGKEAFRSSRAHYMVISNYIHLLVKDTGHNGNVTEARARLALWFTRRVSAGDGL